jgi:nucleoside-diphosphate-sugar epimerase
VNAHLVSGATGFVGGALVLELLRVTDEPVVCIVRASAQDPRQRLLAGLASAAAAYGLPPGLVADNQARILVSVGDITGPVDAITLPDIAIGEVWHSAASLRYEDRDRNEILCTNVGGTRTILELTRRAGAGTLNHISTAYVAGRMTGRIREEIHPGDHPTNNLYELSKIEAERLVTAASGDFAVRILRPSIVIGHSKTYAATNLTGMYGFIRELIRFEAQVSRRLGSFLTLRPVRILADPDAALNLVPVDAVARQAVAISVTACPAAVVHLTNTSPPPVGQALTLLFDRLGLRAPTFVDAVGHFSAIDAEFDRGINFYGSYLAGHKEFDQHAAAAVGTISHDLTDEVLQRYFDWYLARIGRATTRLPAPPALGPHAGAETGAIAAAAAR